LGVEEVAAPRGANRARDGSTTELDVRNAIGVVAS
jgi:hypothetical protein